METSMEKIKMQFTLPEDGWLSNAARKGAHAVKDSDVTITVNGGNKERIAFTFRNECWELLTEDGYIDIQPYKNRVFFRKNGCWKLSTAGKNSKNRYIRVGKPGAVLLKSFIGDYELKYDEYLELFYIEREANK